MAAALRKAFFNTLASCGSDVCGAGSPSCSAFGASAAIPWHERQESAGAEDDDLKKSLERLEEIRSDNRRFLARVVVFVFYCPTGTSTRSNIKSPPRRSTPSSSNQGFGEADHSKRAERVGAFAPGLPRALFASLGVASHACAFCPVVEIDLAS